MWIEIFQTGKWTSAQGRTNTYNTDDLDRIVEKFDPNQKPPVTVGHPENDSAPAFGWMQAVKRVGEKLLGDFEFAPEFLELLKKGIYKNRSIGLKNGAINHVAFLGGWAPAVKGLEEIKFSDYSETERYETSLTTKENDEMTNEELTAQLEAMKAENEKLKADFAEAAKTKDDLEKQLKDSQEKAEKAEAEKREGDLSNFAENLVKEGKITPATKDKLNGLFKKVAGDADNFSEGGIVADLKELFSSLPESETMKGNYACNKKAKEFEERKTSDDYDGMEVDEEREVLRERAKELQKADPKLTFSKAVRMAAEQMKNVKK